MENLREKVIRKFKNKEALVGTVGLGYVGLPLMLRYNSIGFRVLGIGTDAEKARRLNSGESYIEHISAENISHICSSGPEATIGFSRTKECDAPILCVPIPLNKYREPDMSFTVSTTEAIRPYLREGQVVSLESITYPGTTEEELLPRVQSDGLVVGKSISLVCSPEREDPDNPNSEIRTILEVIGGHTPECLEVGVILYEQAIDKVVPVGSTKTAEMTKLLENIHRAVNIGLVNEMKIVADRMGIDIFEVIGAVATKPSGLTPYYLGPGLGGYCIFIDPFYLTWKTRGHDLHTRFTELSDEVNKTMSEYVASKLMDGLNKRGKVFKGSRVLVLGIAYKRNVDDMRESPPVEITELIQTKGDIVSYSDPYVPNFPKMCKHHFDPTSEPLTAERPSRFNAVVLAIDHDQFDYNLIHAHASLVVDSRGKYRALSQKVIKA